MINYKVVYITITLLISSGLVFLIAIVHMPLWVNIVCLSFIGMGTLVTLADIDNDRR